MDNILKNGYDPNDIDPVKTFVREGDYYLFGGHHRVACLAVLGYKKVPRVYIFKSNLSLRLYKFIKRLKC